MNWPAEGGQRALASAALNFDGTRKVVLYVPAGDCLNEVKLEMSASLVAVPGAITIPPRGLAMMAARPSPDVPVQMIAKEVLPGTTPVMAAGAAFPAKVQVTVGAAPAVAVATGAATATMAPITDPARIARRAPRSGSFANNDRDVIDILPVVPMASRCASEWFLCS